MNLGLREKAMQLLSVALVSGILNGNCAASPFPTQWALSPRTTDRFSQNPRNHVMEFGVQLELQYISAGSSNCWYAGPSLRLCRPLLCIPPHPEQMFKAHCRGSQASVLFPTGHLCAPSSCSSGECLLTNPTRSDAGSPLRNLCRVCYQGR